MLNRSRFAKVFEIMAIRHMSDFISKHQEVQAASLWYIFIR
jgi:hypothetical protein